MAIENGQNGAAQNPLDVAYAKMKDVRTLLGRAGYEVGRARVACNGINGIDTFMESLNEVGAKIAFMLGDCISFCDNQQKRVEDERNARIAEIQRLAKESEAKKLAEAKRLSEKDTPKEKMAIAEDAPTPTPIQTPTTVSTVKRGRTRAKAQ